jgi:hypothetical protein
MSRIRIAREGSNHIIVITFPCLRIGPCDSVAAALSPQRHSFVHNAVTAVTVGSEQGTVDYKL